MKKILLLLVVLFIIICGCSKENERPDDVREEIWVNGKAIYQIFDKFKDNKKLLDDQTEAKIEQFNEKYPFTLMPEKEGYSKNEGDITSAIYLMYFDYLNYKVSVLKHELNSKSEIDKKALQGIEKNFDVLTKYYG